MRCQLQTLGDAANRLTTVEKGLLRLQKIALYLVKASRKVLRDPTLIGKKLKRLLSIGRSPPAQCAQASVSEDRATKKSRVLGLRPGELVRVKSLEEIQRTLDANSKCEGMAFLQSVMEEFCGGTYRVRKRVDLFFDERRWRLLKLRNVVILDDVYCENPVDGDEDWAGCQRTCFLFWKEAWLERVPASPSESDAEGSSGRHPSPD
jgi:hypothetical protein